MNELHIGFIDELHVASVDETVTFGRTADIVIDEANQFMHRTVGVFFHQNNVWWVANKCKSSEITLVGASRKLSRLSPDAVAALTEAEGLVRFEAGPSRYELGWARPGQDPLVPPTTDEELGQTIEMTRQFGVVNINDEQRLLLVALADKQLRDSSVPPTDLPSNASVAHRLGWSGKKLDRKLDYLCARLDNEGVRGLRGEKGVEAVDRRARLVAHALSSGMITSSDVVLLEPFDR